MKIPRWSDYGTTPSNLGSPCRSATQRCMPKDRMESVCHVLKTEQKWLPQRATHDNNEATLSPFSQLCRRFALILISEAVLDT